jgi:hypothetical protein
MPILLPRGPLSAVVSVALLSLAGAYACGGESTEASPAPAGDASTVDAAADGATSNADAASGPGDAASTPGADAAAQEKLICDALASRSACPDGAVECEDDIKCIYGRLMLPEAASAYASCRAAPSCKGDDECVVEAGRAAGGSAADTYASDCAARSTACAGAFEDDFCSPALFAYPGAGPGAQACLAKPCAEIEDCIKSLQALEDIAACK